MTARIVPAIDIIDGCCVRLERGAFGTEQVVGEDPLTVTKSFEEKGYRRLHLVDLSGAKQGTPVHLSILEAICASTSIQVDFSGGLRQEADVRAALEAGANKVVIGSAAVKDRPTCEHWFRCFGPERIILGLDLLNGLVRVSGWQESTELSLSTVVDWYVPLGLKTLMSTDISRDGMLQGPAFTLYEELRRQYPALHLIASGGVSSPEDVRELSRIGVSEVIVGKALYAGMIDSEGVREFVW